MIDDPKRRLLVIIEKPAVSSQHAELQRVAAPVPITTTPANLQKIGWCQAPVPGELVFGWLRWKCNSPPRASRLLEIVIYRH